MDRAWMRERLDEYLALLARNSPATTRMGEFIAGDRSVRSELERRRPTVTRILKTLDPTFSGLPALGYLGANAANAAKVQNGLGILDDQDEWATRLAPDAPQLAADRFHPWVWDAARPLWEAGQFRLAVQAAATSINAHLQQKVGRRDVSDDQLIAEVFGKSDPQPGKPRLRFPGDPSDMTVQSRHRGALQFGQGCFWAIRNPATHEHGEWDEQVTLEQLAALSVLARLIDQCEVQMAESDNESGGAGLDS